MVGKNLWPSLEHMSVSLIDYLNPRIAGPGLQINTRTLFGGWLSRCVGWSLAFDLQFVLESPNRATKTHWQDMKASTVQGHKQLPTILDISRESGASWPVLLKRNMDIYPKVTHVS